MAENNRKATQDTKDKAQQHGDFVYSDAVIDLPMGTGQWPVDMPPTNNEHTNNVQSNTEFSGCIGPRHA